MPKASAASACSPPTSNVARTQPFFDQDAFYETELAHRSEQFGHIMHVFSTYESRRSPEAAPFSRGINSIQLYHDGTRWWIVSVLWDGERKDNPIPEKYLK